MTYCKEHLKLVSIYITKLFNEYQTPVLMYHNLVHTLNVVQRSKEIASHYPLHGTELFILASAAWFHDTGHLFGPAKGHEEASRLIMKEYMQTIGVDEKTAREIGLCILATKMPCRPVSLLESILCDADLYHLGTEEFLVTDELVKKEFESRNIFLPANWNETTLKLLESHTFFTSYCRKKLEDQKQINRKLVKELIEKEKIDLQVNFSASSFRSRMH